VFVIAGGAGPTVRPEYYLTDSGIDAVAAGEGEVVLPRILDIIVSGKKTELAAIPGVCVKDEERVCHSPVY